MKYNNIYDMHSHSDNSFDGNHSCILLCESACEKGAKGIAITDHCDIDGKDYDFRAFTTNQFVDVTKAKKAFEGRLEVLRGIELGQGIYEKGKSLNILNSFQYDFVIGAIHNLENTEDFYFMDYKDKDVEKLLREYFSCILELAKWNKTDTIAHLTYPLRYITGRDGIKVDISLFYDIIDEIFETIIKNEKALELNVSGLFQELDDTMPNKKLIKRYKELGGKYVTVGSDSHYCYKICDGIDKGYDILKECGFEQFTIFKNRKPILIDIE